MATLPNKEKTPEMNKTGSKNEKNTIFIYNNSSSLIVLEKVVNNKANRKNKTTVRRSRTRCGPHHAPRTGVQSSSEGKSETTVQREAEPGGAPHHTPRMEVLGTVCLTVPLCTPLVRVTWFFDHVLSAAWGLLCYDCGRKVCLFRRLLLYRCWRLD